MERENLIERLRNLSSLSDFNSLALHVFNYQYIHNSVYNEFCNSLKIKSVSSINEVPFLPIEAFKFRDVKSTEKPVQLIFESSGTTGMQVSKHLVVDSDLYEFSFLKTFHQFYGQPSEWVIIGLLPGYLERSTSSLVYMVNKLIKLSRKPESGFYLNNQQDLLLLLNNLKKENKKVWLIGVSYALLDFSQLNPPVWDQLTVLETGGMKGKRKDLTKDELHQAIKKNWPVQNLHSEYGMTELFSQAYSFGNMKYQCPEWMKVVITDTNSPLEKIDDGKTGLINVIDLANIDSCAFIGTQDLGKNYADGFQILGRYDLSEVRGCNLMLD